MSFHTPKSTESGLRNGLGYSAAGVLLLSGAALISTIDNKNNGDAAVTQVQEGSKQVRASTLQLLNQNTVAIPNQKNYYTMLNDGTTVPRDLGVNPSLHITPKSNMVLGTVTPFRDVNGDQIFNPGEPSGETKFTDTQSAADFIKNLSNDQFHEFEDQFLDPKSPLNNPGARIQQLDAELGDEKRRNSPPEQAIKQLPEIPRQKPGLSDMDA